ncbi:tryptophan-rich sensory protein [Streptomyces sp. NBC_01341]|uniref:TspO/MBR family protein n=1 Tax=Streptomyces sp. NBC_01341 TaxID=2903831 RepID=UPI002E153985|nr:tryptophan-rich sensory protein [Streptomyces sp. NBC_01341]
MRLMREGERQPSSGRWKTYAGSAAAVTVAAVAGSWAVAPDTHWYRSLSKPSWQPPAWAFGAVWTPLYASIAWAGGRALLAARAEERKTLAMSLGVNLTLNTTWNVLFFRLRSTKAGLMGTALLDVSNAELIARTARVDRASALALIPYAAWCGFATCLNASIARKNRR